MKKFVKYLLAFTWELPQTLAALVCILILKAKKFEFKYIDGDEYHNRKLKLITSKFLTCWSLGEWIFINTRYLNYYGKELEDKVIKHEYGHSRQSRIVGPLFLILVGLPSAIWNLLSRLDNKFGYWCHSHYYGTPWEKTADILGGVKR